MDAPTLIIVTGPTASGKSALAVSLAQRLGAEIIGADSRQVYTGMPIVTAMPTAEERAAVPHHLIDFLPIDAYYSASMYEQAALAKLQELFARSPYAVACGGSMMYVDALCHGLDPLPTVPPDLRQALLAMHRRLGDDWLRRAVQQLDPAYYATADHFNIKRLFHALEISVTARAPYSSLCTGTRAERPFRILKFVTTLPRDLLFARINARVDAMVAEGLEEEARRLYPRRSLNALNTVGLKEMFAHFDGVMDRPTAIERIKKNTRVYAKKQMTWYRRDSTAIPVDPLSPHAVESQILPHLQP